MKDSSLPTVIPGVMSGRQTDTLWACGGARGHNGWHRRPAHPQGSPTAQHATHV